MTVKSFLMISNRKIPAVGKASYGRDLLVLLVDVYGLFKQTQLDISRTCVYWNDKIDLASDSIYEYGKAA